MTGTIFTPLQEKNYFHPRLSFLSHYIQILNLIENFLLYTIFYFLLQYFAFLFLNSTHSFPHSPPAEFLLLIILLSWEKPRLSRSMMKLCWTYSSLASFYIFWIQGVSAARWVCESLQTFFSQQIYFPIAQFYHFI